MRDARTQARAHLRTNRERYPSKLEVSGTVINKFGFKRFLDVYARYDDAAKWLVRPDTVELGELVNVKATSIFPRTSAALKVANAPLSDVAKDKAPSKLV